MTYLGSIVAADYSITFTPAAPTGPTVCRSDHITQQKRIRSILAARRARAQKFDRDLFADPAWDMLLELYYAHLGQFDLSVSSLCSGSGVPATTALRWINTMESRGLLQRRPDPTDKRRIFVAISQDAADGMCEVLNQTVSRESLI